MKLIIASFIILSIFGGCQEDKDSNKSTQIQNPIKPNKNPIEDTYKEKTDEENVSEERVTKEKISEKKADKEKDSEDKQSKHDFITPTKDGSFKAIKKLIIASRDNKLKNVTYICVGDSTRAESKYDGEHLFYQVQNRLYDFGVESYLFARAGHKAKEFNNESASPTWENVVYEINGDGRETIVDICLGLNDYWSGNYDFKEDIKEAIYKIRSQRPYVHFMLTMPDRVYGSESMTYFIKNAYLELANELHLPLVNIIDDLMPSQESTSYSWYRHDGYNVHLSREGQRKVAKDILLHILPSN
jgi:hypothetical protein